MANWWENEGKLKPEELKDDTPFEIKSNPVYKKMVERFLTGKFKDKKFEDWMKRTQ